MGWVAAIAGVAVALQLTWFAWIAAAPAPPGVFSDSIDYLEMASVLQGSAASIDLAALAPYRYPPLFPALLALTGASGATPATAVIVTAAMALLAFAASAFWYRRELRGANALAAALAVLALALNPRVFGLPQLDVVSEPLFLLGLLLVLALARPGARPSAVWLAVALLALLPLVRIAGLALTLAALPWLLRHGPARAAPRWLALLALVGPVACWLAWRSASGGESYFSYLAPEVLAGAHGRLALLLSERVAALFATLVRIAAPLGPLGFALGATTSVLAVVGWVGRVRQWRVDACYVPIHAGLVLLWPFPAETERLLLVLWPIVLLYALLGAGVVADRFGGAPPRHAAAALAAALAALQLMPAVAIARRALEPVEPTLAPFQRREAYLVAPDDASARRALELDVRIDAGMHSLRERVGAHDCVWSQNPAFVRFHARVRSAMLPPDHGDPANLRPRLAGCRYVLVIGRATRQHLAPPEQLLRLVLPWSEPLLLSAVPASPGAPPMLALALLEQRHVDAD